MKGRFAPSPTGYMHLGNLWIALLSYLSTRRQKGTFLLRMEDIDRQRSRPEYSDAILDDLEWMGFQWDEGPRAGGVCGSYFQSERTPVYLEVLDTWREKGLLYPCFCKRSRLHNVCSAPHEHEERPYYDGHCRFASENVKENNFYSIGTNEEKGLSAAWRIKIDESIIRFDDIWQGDMKETLLPGCDDFVVRRNDGMFSYQFAVSVDDALMGVTEVVRGYDLLWSTPWQLYLYKLLHYSPPRFGHASLLMDQNGYRLSKRQGGVTIRALREIGMTPQEILGRLAYATGLVQETSCFKKTNNIHNTQWQPLTLQELEARAEIKFAKNPHITLTNFDIKL